MCKCFLLLNIEVLPGLYAHGEGLLQATMLVSVWESYSVIHYQQGHLPKDRNHILHSILYPEGRRQHISTTMMYFSHSSFLKLQNVLQSIRYLIFGNVVFCSFIYHFFVLFYHLFTSWIEKKATIYLGPEDSNMHVREAKVFHLQDIFVPAQRLSSSRNFKATN